MHIIEAFKQAQINRDNVQRDLMDVIVDVINNGDKELAQKLDTVNKSIAGILKPFTD